MKKIILGLTLCAALFSASKASALEAYEVVLKGLGSVVFKTLGGPQEIPFEISYPDRGPNKGGKMHDEHHYHSYEDHLWLERNGKKPPTATTYDQCVVNFSAPNMHRLNQDMMLMPWFDVYGIYDHKDVEENIEYWKRIYPLAPERQYVFRFVPDPNFDRTLVYLDGYLLTRIDGAKAVTGVTPRKGLEIVRKGPVEIRDTGYHELAAIPHRAHKLLEAGGAKLSIQPGEQVVEGIPLTVWKPEESLDQGRHRHTGKHRSLTHDPMHTRSPWRSGPEYMQWTIPGKAWRVAWVLCADIPEEGKLPVVGTNLAKFGDGCTWGTIDFKKSEITTGKKVGTLTYKNAGGQNVTTPLYLVRQPLDISIVGARAKKSFMLDFEFSGTGTAPWQSNGKYSSVQIFGCSLEEAPYDYHIVNPVRGNIFEKGKDVQKSVVEVVSNRDQVKGFFDLEIYDVNYKTLIKRMVPFMVTNRGEKVTLPINLAKFDLGWYGMNMRFLDERKTLVTEHAAAFTVLAPDDREAGYESPYACWPLGDGYHGSNPNPEEQMEVMRKAGYRNTWHPPCKDEASGAPWKVGCSSVGVKTGGYNPGDPAKSRQEFDKRLDRTVAHYREMFTAFPHCQVIQLLHEQGGREIAEELIGKREVKRGEYRGWDFDTPGLKSKERGDWEVFFCTEYAKRMRKEFPDKKIMLGNGSSSSEKVASLVRRGLDLKLVDQLGIESKGFTTMPELAANREAPGMLWALGETGRIFGYDHLTLNACNEYVFRPERPGDVSRKVDPARRMLITNYTLRDYLISLAHGCSIISTGHLEDAADAYYDTNWGAGGQCTAYPYSYPKRMFTALAVLTRVLDCPKYQRRLPTGETVTYALEFLRDRKVKDYAYALWTPQFPCVLEMTFPKNAKVTRYEPFGRSRVEKLDATGKIKVPVGATPRYVVSNMKALSSCVVAHPGPKPAKDAKCIFTPSLSNCSFSERPLTMDEPGPGVPGTRLAKFTMQEEAAPEIDKGAKGVSFTLQPSGKCPEVINEGTEVSLKGCPEFKADEIGGFGMWVKGNGSFGKFRLLFKATDKNDGYPGCISFSASDLISFDGWRYLTAKMPARFDMGRSKTAGRTFKIRSAVVGTARVNLNPIEMAPVEGDFAIGPIYLLPKAVEEKQAADRSVDELMKNKNAVGDKDL